MRRLLFLPISGRGMRVMASPGSYPAIPSTLFAQSVLTVTCPPEASNRLTHSSFLDQRAHPLPNASHRWIGTFHNLNDGRFVRGCQVAYPL